MVKNDELIHKGKALKDLEGIKDVLLAQGDPFLASIMNRAIECIKNQPAAEVPQIPEINVLKCCATCAHNVRCIPQPGISCHNCTSVTCTCRECVDYSKWTWRDGHG